MEEIETEDGEAAEGGAFGRGLPVLQSNPATNAGETHADGGIPAFGYVHESSARTSADGRVMLRLVGFWGAWAAATHSAKKLYW